MTYNVGEHPLGGGIWVWASLATLWVGNISGNDVFQCCSRHVENGVVLAAHDNDLTRDI